jgi:hypothetical protein
MDIREAMTILEEEFEKEKQQILDTKLRELNLLDASIALQLEDLMGGSITLGGDIMYGLLFERRLYSNFEFEEPKNGC